jgi:diacylglycerol kinase family enzyme
LRRRGQSPRIIGDLAEITALAAERNAVGRLRALVAAGGDGTLAELVNRTLAVFPLGTENLLARYIDMPRDPEAAARVIADGFWTRQDAADAAGRLFMLVAGFGFDAEVIHRMHELRDGHISRWSYLRPIWSAIRSYDYPELRITCDPGEPHERTVSGRFAFVINCPGYALGLQIVPGARGDDGLLDICTLRGGSFFHGLWYLGNIVLRRHPRLADCTLATARRVRIESERPAPYELDGDPGGMLPLDIAVQPGRLTLIVPREWLERRQAIGSSEQPITTKH